MISGSIHSNDDHSSVGEVVICSMSEASSASVRKSSGGRLATSWTIAMRSPSGDSVAMKRPSPSVSCSRLSPSKSIQKTCSLNGEPSFVRIRKRDRSSGIVTLSTSQSPVVSACLVEPSASTAYSWA